MTAIAARAASASTVTLRALLGALRRALGHGARHASRLIADFHRYMDAAHKVPGR